MNDAYKHSLGLLLVIFGSIIFVWAAGIFIFRLLVALLGLLLINYGFQLWQGKNFYHIFLTWRKR